MTTIETNGKISRIDLKAPIDISIPLRFNGPQPNAFGVETAKSHPVRAGSLIGDTRFGGSVNFEQYTFIPHCSGTHTECVGHITHERISVRACLRDALMRAWVLSVVPEPIGGDLLITAASLGAAKKSVPGAAATGFFGGKGSGSIEQSDGGSDIALIVRTLPNAESKVTRSYGEGDIPPYFSTDAMTYIVQLGFTHLLVDMPSIDRLFDDGKLANHRIFWNIEEGSFEINDRTRINSTITELIYVPNEVADGEYLLNLQIAPFESDAAPSRPILWALM